MTECWREGDLRAFADGELDAAASEQLAEHLEGCPACRARYQGLSERAARVASWMAALHAPSAPARRAEGLRMVRAWPSWAAAVAAAACLALVLMNPRTGPAPPATTARIAGQFVALDDEPVGTGLVVRVAVGPDQVQADVIIGADGRARAFRLVGDGSTN